MLRRGKLYVSICSGLADSLMKLTSGQMAAFAWTLTFHLLLSTLFKGKEMDKFMQYFQSYDFVCTCAF